MIQQIQCCAPLLIAQAMVLSLWYPILLEEGHTTSATLIINYLDLSVELVSLMVTGVEHHLHAFVSVQANL